MRGQSVCVRPRRTAVHAGAAPPVLDPAEYSYPSPSGLGSRLAGQPLRLRSGQALRASKATTAGGWHFHESAKIPFVVRNAAKGFAVEPTSPENVFREDLLGFKKLSSIQLLT
jgi:hypothetical protein